jgi:hypothetical protein
MVSRIGSVLGCHSFFLSLCMSNERSGLVMICSHSEVMCEYQMNIISGQMQVVCEYLTIKSTVSIIRVLE